jgi:hypothetical protein
MLATAVSWKEVVLVSFPKIGPIKPLLNEIRLIFHHGKLKNSLFYQGLTLDFALKDGRSLACKELAVG